MRYYVQFELWAEPRRLGGYARLAGPDREREMLKQSLIIVSLWILAGASVSGQQPGELADPMRPYTPAHVSAADAGPKPDYRVSGVLVSPSGRVAIINDTLMREGDRIAGAVIVSIEPSTVHMRIGSREVTAHLGSDVLLERSSSQPVQVAHEPASGFPALERSVSESVPTSGLLDQLSEHAVQRGETLSGIAQYHLRDGVTLNQMMVALFEANSHAFGGNINYLHAGAVLRIPDGDELGRYSPAIATAEVARQETAWRNAFEPQPVLASTPHPASYGPVNDGETLSGIATHLSSDGITMNQMMIALFETNSHAFGGNINVLFAGAVLRLPDSDELRGRAPAAANAEVARQTEAWRAGPLQQAVSTTSPRGGDTQSPLVASAN